MPVTDEPCRHFALDPSGVLQVQTSCQCCFWRLAAGLQQAFVHSPLHDVCCMQGTLGRPQNLVRSISERHLIGVVPEIASGLNLMGGPVPNSGTAPSCPQPSRFHRQLLFLISLSLDPRHRNRDAARVHRRLNRHWLRLLSLGFPTCDTQSVRCCSDELIVS